MQADYRQRVGLRIQLRVQIYSRMLIRTGHSVFKMVKRVRLAKVTRFTRPDTTNTGRCYLKRVCLA